MNTPILVILAIIIILIGVALIFKIIKSKNKGLLHYVYIVFIVLAIYMLTVGIVNDSLYVDPNYINGIFNEEII